MSTHLPGCPDDAGDPLHQNGDADSSSWLTLLSELLRDFGEDFKTTSVFVCAADSIGGAEIDIDSYCAELWKARRGGKVRSELALMRDDEFESSIRASGKEAADRYAQLAAHKLSELLNTLVDVSSAERLITILGVARTPSGFFPILRDEEIARKIVRMAKLMDKDYKTSIAVRMIIARERGEKIEDGLLDQDDPHLAQIWLELQDEV
jgi:hypothetical protein